MNFFALWIVYEKPQGPANFSFPDQTHGLAGKFTFMFEKKQFNDLQRKRIANKK